MILIKKGKKPASLITYKQQMGAYYDGVPDKGDIRQALLMEQGYICAYCMKRIKQETMTIEHYIPQAKDVSFALDYRNMLGVCMGNRGNKAKDMTCDAHRGNVEMHVNPLDESTIRMIKYKTDGTIYSDDVAIDKDLNSTLNLNCDAIGVLLKTNRKAALEVLTNYLEKKKQEGTWSKPFLLSVKDKFLRSQDKNREYRGIMDDYIDNRVRRA